MNGTDIIEERDVAPPGSFAMNLVTTGLAALSSKALVWVAALGGGFLWTLAMLEPAWIKLAVALGYCGSVLLPILVRDAKR